MPSSSLADLPFTDIFISATGDRCKLIGMEKEGVMTDVPTVFKRQVFDLRDHANRKSHERNQIGLAWDNQAFRCTRMKGQTGEYWMIRRSRGVIPIEEIGLKKRLIGRIEEIGAENGLILIAGAMGSRKTTTAYAIHDLFRRKFGGFSATVEDPPEIPIEGSIAENEECIQIEADEDDFQSEFRLLLRARPKFILIGEMRGGAAVKSVVNAAGKGHGVISTAHSPGPVETISALLDFTDSADRDAVLHGLAQTLALIIHQKLNEDGSTEYKILCPFEKLGIRTAIRENRLHELASDVEAQTLKLVERG